MLAGKGVGLPAAMDFRCAIVTEQQLRYGDGGRDVEWALAREERLNSEGRAPSTHERNLKTSAGPHVKHNQGGHRNKTPRLENEIFCSSYEGFDRASIVAVRLCTAASSRGIGVEISFLDLPRFACLQ